MSGTNHLITKACFLCLSLIVTVFYAVTTNAQTGPNGINPLLSPGKPVVSIPTLYHWSTAGSGQFLEASGSALHLKPRVDGTGPGNVTATCKLTLAARKNWQISFDIRFGVLRDQASSFHLTQDGIDVGWTGADGFTKQMGIFIGKDDEVYGTNANADWHH